MWSLEQVVIYKISSIVAIVLGLAMLGNGVFMIFDPNSWYLAVPGVADRGPFNQHFLRDIGFVYVLGSAAFIYGALAERTRWQLWIMPTAWLLVHALFHVWEVIVGLSEPQALVQDFMGVTVPAVVSLVLLVISLRGDYSHLDR